jgi:NADH-quinone oxidoreductase subunit D
MTIGFRERELVLDLFELITGLRMNHAFIRPGGVSQDLPPGALDEIRSFIALMKKRLPEYADLCNANPIFKGRLEGVGHLDPRRMSGARSDGARPALDRLPVGPPQDPALQRLRDLRLRRPDLGHLRLLRTLPGPVGRDVGVAEDRRAGGRPAGDLEGAPVMVADKKIAWPSQLAIGSDGMGNSLDHIRHIMGESMEALIHHFKLVTEGFRVPPGQAYVPIESPRGELGAHVVSDGGTRPFRAHFRDPSFTNLQATSVMSEGGMVADVIVAIASIDPVMGGVDR